MVYVLIYIARENRNEEKCGGDADFSAAAK